MGYPIPKQTAAETSETIDLTRGPFPITVHQVGLLVAETIAVNVVDDDDAALPLYDQDGVAVVLAVNSQPLTIPSPIRLQFVKGVTANEVGVQVTRPTHTEGIAV
jgi:hypothetical protein